MTAFFQNIMSGFASGHALGVSMALFDITAILFLLSSVFYMVYLAWRKEPVWMTGLGLAAVGAAVQTLALALRWIAAGWDHPPFTNLYESLVFFGWGIVVVYIVVEAKYKVKVAGALIIPIAFFAMGMASLSPNKGIEPLMPALQDIWLHLHVFSASIGYAAFLVAFGFAVLYLLKDRVPMEYFGTVSCFFTLFAAISVTKGQVLFFRFLLTKMQMAGGMLTKIPIPGTDLVAKAPIPLAGEMLFGVCLLCVLCAILFSLTDKKEESSQGQKRAFSLFFIATFLMTLFLIHVIITISSRSDLSASAEVYGLAFLGTSWFFMVLTLLFYVRRDALIEMLPDTKTLDLLGYRAIIVAFPIMTFVIVSGAVWANKAWGRYWGWDPKETASLITWAIYLLYLHARFTAKWSGRRAALISIIGFISVVFTYLGVNLVLSGLHSYASG